jgi:hypothetical protein
MVKKVELRWRAGLKEVDNSFGLGSEVGQTGQPYRLGSECIG